MTHPSRRYDREFDHGGHHVGILHDAAPAGTLTADARYTAWPYWLANVDGVDHLTRIRVMGVYELSEVEVQVRAWIDAGMPAFHTPPSALE